MGVFTRAGYEAVAPAIIQPAGMFLDGVGEALRARTYVFTDIGGSELCLRPDLTMPTCRLHVERVHDPATPARYCYNGAAFRYQASDADAAHPREFRQAGIESIGERDGIAAEAQTLALMIEAASAAGLDRRKLHLRFGDLALMRSLLGALDMPDRWRQRLKGLFWQPASFRAELARLTRDPAARARRLPPDLIRALRSTPEAGADAILSAHLDATGREAIGARGVDEIADSVRALLADISADPLPTATAALIETYVATQGPCLQAARTIRAAAKAHAVNLEEPLSQFETRLAALQDLGLDLAAATFSGDFGRSLEYYTGFVFEVAMTGASAANPILGGGRYDGLMRLAGSPVDVPAVGAAIHTERLLAACSGELK